MDMTVFHGEEKLQQQKLDLAHSLLTLTQVK